MSSSEILLELKSKKNHKKLGRVVKKDFEETPNIYAKIVEGPAPAPKFEPKFDPAPAPVSPKFEPKKDDPVK